MAEHAIEFSGVIPAVICKDFAQSSTLEWLQTNHTGAFSMGTVCGVNTRRYHGLLIATLNPPSDRYSVFPRVEEVVNFDGQMLPLATVQYSGAVSPAGYELLEEFSSSPIPTWRFVSGTLTVTKTIRLIDGEQSVVLSYQSNAECKLAIRLFVSFRDYHSLTHQNTTLNEAISEYQDHLSIQPYQDLPPIHFYHASGSFERNSSWFLNHEYLRELERGLDFREDLYSPGLIHFALRPDQAVHLIATLEKQIPDVGVAPQAPKTPLCVALDQFRVTRVDDKPTLMAGYPWFTDWSRDTLISLPALLTCGFESAEVKAILEFLLAERKQGILPNRFSDRESTPEYNTVDASLWFFVAAHAYINKTKDKSFVAKTLFPAAMDIIDWHIRGTFFGIHVDPADHLLASGEPGTQLTWMDAKIGDFVVTPRTGKAVEINALWFNALLISSYWASLVGSTDIARQFSDEAKHVRSAFAAKFWNPARNCLYDVVTAAGPDPSLRPNQMFALSLPYPIVDRAKAQLIIEVVKQILLTPVGLRTLEPSDPRYRPHYRGNPYARDSAYHQGTVWPWLIGPFIEAYLYAFNNSSEAIIECKGIANSMLGLMANNCLGSIGEVYDADAPHNPGGCPAQLWSVAQLALSLHRVEQS